MINFIKDSNTIFFKEINKMIEAKRMRVMLDVQPVMGRQTMLNFTCYQPTLIGLVKTKSAYIIHQFIVFIKNNNIPNLMLGVTNCQ